MRSSRLIWFLAGALTVGLAVILNPSPERHRERIKEGIAQRSQLAALLHLGDLTAFVSTYHSVGVASYTTANQRTVTIGAFGMVFVLDPSSDD